MTEIQQLKTDVVDQISAGEVVDRPAHMVKELLENAIDAGADNIDLSLSQGGQSLRITDNGRGIYREDLPKVFSRHATSKIVDSEDLWKLETFGFRGEALASISSVAHISIRTRKTGQDASFALESQFGKLGEIVPCSQKIGTQIDVKDLFLNIPARKKFLKSDAAEMSQIKNVVKAMALAHPQVGFKVKINDKLTFLWGAVSTLLERTQQVLEIPQMYSHASEHQDFKVEFVFSDPGKTQRVSRQIWLFVQNRWVQDKSLQAAVVEAYRSLLMHGEYPYCVVKLQVPPERVDVNIHPTKSQIKFLDQKEAFRAVYRGLREKLEQAPWQTEELGSKLSMSPTKEENDLNITNQRSTKGGSSSEFGGSEVSNLSFPSEEMKQTQYKTKVALGKTDSLQRTSRREMARDKKYSEDSIKIRDLSAAAQGRDEIVFFNQESSGENEESKKDNESLERGPWSRLQVVGQINLTYIAAQDDTSFWLIDQHAAHERVAYERLMQHWKNNQMERQKFLIPLTLDLEETEVEALIQDSSELQRLGVSIEQAGPGSLCVLEIPAMISESAIVKTLKMIATESQNWGGSFALEKTVSHIFATMACHSVVRAGQALSQEQMVNLLQDMDEFPLSGFCPHGRPVAVDKKFIQLEKEFCRRV